MNIDELHAKLETLCTAGVLGKPLPANVREAIDALPNGERVTLTTNIKARRGKDGISYEVKSIALSSLTGRASMSFSNYWEAVTARDFLAKENEDSANASAPVEKTEYTIAPKPAKTSTKAEAEKMHHETVRSQAVTSRDYLIAAPEPAKASTTNAEAEAPRPRKVLGGPIAAAVAATPPSQSAAAHTATPATLDELLAVLRIQVDGTLRTCLRAMAESLPQHPAYAMLRETSRTLEALTDDMQALPAAQ